jgi:hypothetical protein
MTALKTSALVASLVGAFAIGVVARPYVMHDRSTNTINTTPAVVTAPAAESHAAKPATPAIVTRADQAKVTPALMTRVKPLLRQGADMTIAAQGFTNGEQFAAVAHAANNLDIPFMVLKHQVLDQHMALVRAIHVSRPDVAADIEANRARAEARSDVVATVSGV